MATKKRKVAPQKLNWLTAVYRLAVVSELAAILYIMVDMLRGEVGIYRMIYSVINASTLH